MREENNAENRRNPIWLLGDSNPVNDSDVEFPLDPRHPAIHNIWTPVLEKIQEACFVNAGKLLDPARFYARNAVQDPAVKKTVKTSWEAAAHELETLRALLLEYRPPVVLTFGSFAYAFARKALGDGSEKYRPLGIPALRRAFDGALQAFSPGEVNTIPLLHAIVAQQYAAVHRHYDGDYFAYTAKRLTEALLLPHFAAAPVWLLRDRS